MKVIWSDLAAIELQYTADYLLAEYGAYQQDLFLSEIDHLAQLLAANPFMGKAEPLLDGLPHLFRSIVVTHVNKLIYTISNDTIEIVDFWNTRRNPQTLVGRLS